MRYIKEYNMFKSKSPIDIDDIKDILLDLEDNGFIINVKKDHNASYNPSKGEYSELPNKNVFDNIQIQISKKHTSEWYTEDPEYDFNADEIEEYIERIFDYINQKGIDFYVEYSYNASFTNRYSDLIKNEFENNKEEFPENMYLEFIIIDISIKKNWIQKKLDKWKQRR